MEVGRTSIGVKLGVMTLTSLITFEAEAVSEDWEQKSVAYNSVSPEMSSTHVVQLWVGDDGGVCVEGITSVANHGEQPDRSAGLRDGKGTDGKREER